MHTYIQMCVCVYIYIEAWNVKNTLHPVRAVNRRPNDAVESLTAGLAGLAGGVEVPRKLAELCALSTRWA